LKYTPSNSVNFTYNKQVVGIGSGQQNRVACIHLAGDKCNTWDIKQKQINEEFDPLYTMCSDGFLPFRDNIEAAEKYPINIILQPGGSIRDEEIEEYANYQGIDMIYTNQRAFYH
jgi:phosphoribosylaminoimidazolecarboxamide formyltransferase/IMP cyclohydrolase